MHITHTQYTVKKEDMCIYTETNTRHILAIADGHGGSKVAQICRDNLSNLIEELSNQTIPTPQEFENIFQKLHTLSYDHYSGAALSVCIIDKASRCIGCANVGDVHCYIVSPSSYTILNTSHRLQDNAAERTRLGDSVRINLIGPPRMFPGGLACSRGIGDYDCPTSSCKPAVCYETIGQYDDLIIASDGIWDSVAIKRVMNTVRQTHSAHTVIRLRSHYPDDASVIVASHQEPIQRLGLKWLFKPNTSSSSSDEDDFMPADKKCIPVVL